jgi:hypothetical protein
VRPRRKGVRRSISISHPEEGHNTDALDSLSFSFVENRSENRSHPVAAQDDHDICVIQYQSPWTCPLCSNMRLSSRSPSPRLLSLHSAAQANARGLHMLVIPKVSSQVCPARARYKVVVGMAKWPSSSEHFFSIYWQSSTSATTK